MNEADCTDCAGCRAPIRQSGDLPEEFCPSCAGRLPPALRKACCDPFDYACGLRTGEVVRFNQAEVHGEWVTLRGMPDSKGAYEAIDGMPYPCPRGVDVRLADIVWVADAPNGS